MKILYVITRAELGGAQVHLVDLLKNLPDDFMPIVATGENGYLCDECSRLGVPVRLVPELVQPVHPIKDLRALIGLVSLMRRELPDLVHAHTSKAGLLGRLAARMTATPVVFTAHTWSFADGISVAQRRMAIPLERVAAAMGGKIITVSETNKKMALKNSITTSKSLVRIWNGIPDVAYRANPGSQKSITLVMVARFVAQKDHFVLLQALSGINEDWQLVLVGDGPNRGDVEHAVSKLRLDARVEFAGERGDIPKILARADIFVLTSQWEGLPLVILEAMRAGLPVIATDVGGVAETVTDGVTGYLTPRGNSIELRDRLQRLMGNPDLIRQMGQAGRRRYELDFRLQTMVDKTLAVYREMVAGRIVSVAASEVSVR